MESTITLQEAQINLAQLIARLTPGEEVVITENARPIARLVAEQQPLPQARQPGSAVGKIFILQEDEQHLRDFEEYLR